MSKLMYSEAGGFHIFADGKTVPTGWVDGEPIRQFQMAAKAPAVIAPTAVAPEVPPHPQDTPKRRPGRPPKTSVVENDLGNFPNPD